MFGFWGVFFAIPLATLVQAIIKAWFSRNLSTGDIEGETNATLAG